MSEDEIKQEIQIAEALIRKTNKIIKEKGPQIEDYLPAIQDKIPKLQAAIEKKDITLIRAIMDELQVPMSQISAIVYEPAKKEQNPTECDSCQVSFKLPPGLGPKIGPKKMKKKKEDKVVDKNSEVD